jgi:hypothetical protein
MFGVAGGTSVALPQAADLKALYDLLELLRDPNRSAEAVAQLQSAAEKNEQVLASVRQERAALEAARAEHGPALERERKEFAALLDRERMVWREEQTKRQAQLEAWEKQAQASFEQAEKDRNAAAALKRDLEQRLARMHELAA